MRITLQHHGAAGAAGDLLAIGVYEGRLGDSAAYRTIDQATEGLLTDVAGQESFGGRSGETLSLPSRNTKAARVLVVGLGDEDHPAPAARILGFHAAREARRTRAKRVALLAPATRAGDRLGAMEALTTGFEMGSYKFAAPRQDAESFPVSRLDVLMDGPTSTSHSRDVRAALEQGRLVGSSVNRARDLVNGPANEVTPSHLAKVARAIGRTHKLKVKVLDRKACEKLGMGLYTAVAQGADEEPRFIHMTYEPSRGTSRRTLGLIGKGITFDSGGLSLKDPANMEDMKSDMAGGAAVISAMAAIAAAKPPVTVHAVCAATENMPSGHAYRPGDVFRGMSGRTIEVLNTDAEGRLTLADAIHYVTEIGVDEIVELSTLTGACMVALGKYTAGLMTPDDGLASRVEQAAREAGEDFWRLPLVPLIADDLRSENADAKNIGARWGGAISAGHFLMPFAGDTPLAHCDIAGPSFADKPWGFHQKGGTGIGVLTLYEFVRHAGRNGDPGRRRGGRAPRRRR